MGTSAAAIATDSLGRRTRPRLRRSIREKRQIVKETFQSGVSVAVVARRHDVNANSVFGWRRQYQKGQLGSGRAVRQASLLPVSVVPEGEPARPPSRRAGSAERSSGKTESAVDVELAGGLRVRVHGELAHELVQQLIKAMLAR